MTDERRKKRLKTLIDERFSGSQRLITEAMEWSSGRCSQLLSEKHPFGEDAAKKIIEKLGLDEDYFDRELGESKQTVTVLEKQDMAMALFNAYTALVKVLSKNGSLSVADLSNEIGNTLDFRRSNGIESADQNHMLELVYKSVLQIEKFESDLAALKADFDKKLQDLHKPPRTE